MFFKKIARLVIIVGSLLLIPLIGMQFNSEIKWSVEDFIIAGLLLLGAGFVYELISKVSKNQPYRFAVGITVVTALFLVWANLAVGLIGNENNPANLLYGLVLVTGVIGALVTRLKPLGMRHVLIAMAIVQVLVPVAALIIWRPDISTWLALFNIVQVLAVNFLFVLLWLFSAALFKRSAV